MRRPRWQIVLRISSLVVAASIASTAPDGVAADPQLAGTRPLTMEGDIARSLVAGVDRFLLNELQASIAGREKFWQRDFASTDAYTRSLESNRARLARILGVRDPRVPFSTVEYVATTSQPAMVAESDKIKVLAVRWPAFGDVTAEGLLLLPKSNAIAANIVAIPDADQSPESMAGLPGGNGPPFARALAEMGCRVLVPTLIGREMKPRAPKGRGGGAKLTDREYLYRSAFEVGRHLVGYEVQKVLAGVDWFVQDAANTDPDIGVIGYGEGGMIALYSAALDTRIDACAVHGFFGSRQNIWQEPIDRNVFGLLERYGDAELAAMIFPRALRISPRGGPTVTLPSEGGAPARLLPVAADDSQAEWQRYLKLVAPGAEKLRPSASSAKVAGLLEKAESAADGESPSKAARPLHPAEKPVDPAQRHARQFQELDRFNQQVLAESPYVRQEFMKKLNYSSLEAYQQSVEEYREIFRKEVIGHFDRPLLPFNAQSRKAYETEKWTGYELTLDVFPDVIAYGVLLLPKDLKPGEKRPVVVCQHGLEGRPRDVIEGDNPAYHDFAAKLAERGFITFAPQNLYIFRDDFRTLQRKANPLGKTLFSVIVPQHQQIVNWLKTQPFVDPERIAFYGLSYGGKSAMRIPPLVTDYCLSICSADFNEWVVKNASNRLPFSYVWTGEYEIFEFDLGSTFNYAEMAALICPRPFMVERGHTDGVSTDEWVAFEFAKVRFLYSHRLKIPDRVEMEVFDGPHTINGVGTYEFLHRHLNWPKRS
jgi:dienelactone hydrolase